MMNELQRWVIRVYRTLPNGKCDLSQYVEFEASDIKHLPALRDKPLGARLMQFTRSTVDEPYTLCSVARLAQ